MPSIQESITEIGAIGERARFGHAAAGGIASQLEGTAGAAAALAQELEQRALEAAAITHDLEELQTATAAVGYGTAAEAVGDVRARADEARQGIDAGRGQIASVRDRLGGIAGECREAMVQLQLGRDRLAAAVQRLTALTAVAASVASGVATGGEKQSGSASKPTKSHGAQQKRAGVTTGPVRFSVPRKLEGKATNAHRGEVQEYIDAANKALADGDLSKIGRVRPSQDDDLKADKIAAARRERLRAERAGEPYGKKVAAHLPDTTWTGTADPPGGWGRHEEEINASLGSQSDKYPVGYKPTKFEMDETWDSIDSESNLVR